MSTYIFLKNNSISHVCVVERVQQLGLIFSLGSIDLPYIFKQTLYRLIQDGAMDDGDIGNRMFEKKE